MSPRIKIKPSDGRVFFTSDGHFNQENLAPCASRGYLSRDERTWGQIQAWNSVVTNDDIVIDHGDLVFNDPKGEFFETLINQLNFKDLYLIGGNHLSGTKKWFDLNQLQTRSFKNDKQVCFVGFYQEFIVYDQLICSCHYPLAVWNEMKNGTFHTFGHCHNNYKLGSATDLTAKCLDVGFDQFKKPINFFDVNNIMSKKGFLEIDHHV